MSIKFTDNPTQHPDDDPRNQQIIAAHDALIDHHLSIIRSLVQKERELGVTGACQHEKADFSYICDVCYETVYPETKARRQQTTEERIGEKMDDLGIALLGMQRESREDSVEATHRLMADACRERLDIRPLLSDYPKEDYSDCNSTVIPPEPGLGKADAICGAPPGFHPEPLLETWKVRGHFHDTIYTGDDHTAHQFARELAERFSTMIEAHVFVTSVARVVSRQGTYRASFAVDYTVSGDNLDSAIVTAHDCARDMSDVLDRESAGCRVIVANVRRAE